MRVYIYYCEWDGKNGSHDLLRQAAFRYLEDMRHDIKIDFINKLGHVAEKQQGAWRVLKEKNMSDGSQKLLAITQDRENGKPYFKDMTGLHFSISHSGVIWSCAFSDSEVGLDIQELHDRNCEKIARRFYHPMEILWLEKNGFHQFSRLWAYKESYVKYTGDGLINGLDYFSVVSEDSVKENDIKKNLKMETAKGAGELGAEGVYQQEVLFQENFWMVVTSENPVQVVLKEL